MQPHNRQTGFPQPADGHWIVYSANPNNPGGLPSPNRGVFVQPYPSTGALYKAPKISNDFHPVWPPDGKAIFYMPTAARFVRVTVMPTPTLSFGRPEEWPGIFGRG
jgi:hypothetical protein